MHNVIYAVHESVKETDSDNARVDEGENEICTKRAPSAILTALGKIVSEAAKRKT